MKKILKNRVAAVAAGAVVVVGLGAGAASADPGGLAGQVADLVDRVVALEQAPPPEQGEPGEDGADGVSGYEVAGVEVTVPEGAQNFVRTQNCPEGKVATGGGIKISGGNAGEITIDHSMPGNLVENASGDWVATGWTVQVDNNSTRSGSEQVIAYVVCASAN